MVSQWSTGCGLGTRRSRETEWRLECCGTKPRPQEAKPSPEADSAAGVKQREETIGTSKVSAGLVPKLPLCGLGD